MKRLILIGLLFLFGMTGVIAQNGLSKREIRKQEKIRDLQEVLSVPKIRFVAQKMSSSSGQNVSARGGILFVDNNRGEFMEFLLTDNSGQVSVVSVDFDIENYTTTGLFNNGEIEVNFSGILKNTLYRFKLIVKESGKTYMQVVDNKGMRMEYYGRISKK
jgi:hypothetical protein